MCTANCTLKNLEHKTQIAKEYMALVSLLFDIDSHIYSKSDAKCASGKKG